MYTIYKIISHDLELYDSASKNDIIDGLNEIKDSDLKWLDSENIFDNFIETIWKDRLYDLTLKQYLSDYLKISFITDKDILCLLKGEYRILYILYNNGNSKGAIIKNDNDFINSLNEFYKEEKIKIEVVEEEF